jgi:hypothetical protein
MSGRNFILSKTLENCSNFNKKYRLKILNTLQRQIFYDRIKNVSNESIFPPFSLSSNNDQL